MKKLTHIATAVFALIISFSSCKKDKTIISEPQAKKLIKVEQTGSATNTRNYLYNVEGRLTEMKSNFFTFQYDYSSSPFLQSTFNNSSVKTYELKTTASSGGKIATLESISLLPNGSINYTEVNKYQYNAEGYMTHHSLNLKNYMNEFTGGNLTKTTETASGATLSTFTYEYYTDKEDKFNINWLEHTFQERYLNDKELFGKNNKNLLKKSTYTYPSGNNYSYEFVYTLDAEGYVTECTATEKTNGTVSGVYTYKFFYQ